MVGFYLEYTTPLPDWRSICLWQTELLTDKEDASNIGKKICEGVKKNVSTWAEIAEQFIEKLTIKGM
jgi:hypothetical protein